MSKYAEAIDNLTNHLITDWQQWLDDVTAAVEGVANAERAELLDEVKQLRVDVQYLNDRLADRRDQLEAAEAKVARVEELHAPFKMYEECGQNGCDRDDCTESVLDGQFFHGTEPTGVGCEECRDEDGQHLAWPCPTRMALGGGS